MKSESTRWCFVSSQSLRREVAPGPHQEWPQRDHGLHSSPSYGSRQGPTAGPHCSEGWALGQDGAFPWCQEGKHMGWVSQVTCLWTCGPPPPKLVLSTRKPSLRALAGRRDPSPRQGLALSSLLRPLVADLAPPKLLAQARSSSDKGRDGGWPFCSEGESLQVVRLAWGEKTVSRRCCHVARRHILCYPAGTSHLRIHGGSPGRFPLILCDCPQGP